jgi:hypothetical protein
MRGLTLLVPLAFLVACNGGGNPPPSPQPSATPQGNPEPSPQPELAAISTDRSHHYRFVEGPHGDELVIRSTLTAPADDPLYVVNCNGQISTGLQAERDGLWTDVWTGAINQCLSEPIVIPPGESYGYDVLVRRGSGSVKDGVNDLPPPGTYRVVWHGVLRSFDPERYPFGEPIPEELRTSSPIVIE